MTFDPLAWITDELAGLDRDGLLRTHTVRDSPQDAAEIELDGQTFVNFSSNDYLGLANHSSIPDAVRRALETAGWGSGASPLVTGRHTLHDQLEQELAEFEGAEAALLFTSGYAANVGVLTALAGRGDVIFSDALNHASIIDGCRLSGARVVVYNHNSVEHLRERLGSETADRHRFIVSDSLFSMDGDVAPIGELTDLAERYQATLIVDEAHATGVFGEQGRGVCEAAGVEQRVPVRVGTLSKALGSHGGFVVGSRALIDWLANRARSYVFSTAAPAALCAAGLAALRLVRDEPRRRTDLLAAAAGLRRQLGELGWRYGDSTSQIVPIYIGDASETMALATRLRDRGLLVPGIRPPSVPRGKSLLRISLTAGHSERHVEQLLNALGSALGSAECGTGNAE